eukprot:1977300-Rhodomonas_salina.10
MAARRNRPRSLLPPSLRFLTDVRSFAADGRKTRVGSAAKRCLEATNAARAPLKWARDDDLSRSSPPPLRFIEIAGGEETIDALHRPCGFHGKDDGSRLSSSNGRASSLGTLCLIPFVQLSPVIGG